MYDNARRDNGGASLWSLVLQPRASIHYSTHTHTHRPHSVARIFPPPCPFSPFLALSTPILVLGISDRKLANSERGSTDIRKPRSKCGSMACLHFSRFINNYIQLTVVRTQRRTKEQGHESQTEYPNTDFCRMLTVSKFLPFPKPTDPRRVTATTTLFYNVSECLSCCSKY